MVQLMNFMTQAIDVALTDRAINELLSNSSTYADWDVGVAQKIFKKNYYENFPFVLERLPVFLVYSLNASIYWYDVSKRC